MAGLPFLKLGTLALKTISKPIANRLKKQATFHPKFRRVIVDLAQANHRFTTQMTRRMYGHRTDVEIRALNEEKAVQVASDLIGETFVFMVAGVAVIFEVQRSAKSEARKEAARKQVLEAMQHRDEELAKELDTVKRKVEELKQQTKELQGSIKGPQRVQEQRKPS